MADEHLYTTTAEVLRYMQVSDASDETKAAIAQLIDPVSRRIDKYCRQRFYAITKTVKYDFQKRERLWLREPILSITSIVNGNTQNIPPGNYFLYPMVGPPYYYIDIDRQKGIYFEWSGTTQQCISVTGSWGYSSSAPSMIQMGANAWIARLLPVSSNGSVQSKSIGSFSVSFGSSIDLKEVPGEIKNFIDAYIYRQYNSTTGYS